MELAGKWTKVLWIAVLLIAVGLSAKKAGCGHSPTGMAENSRRRTQVIVTPIYLRYIEDGKVLEFNVDSMVDGTRVVFLPSAPRWRRTMPAWAADRRDEIVAEMKRLTKGRKLEWEEFD
jgi:hypothetical protein